jgi:hypothetical protein
MAQFEKIREREITMSQIVFKNSLNMTRTLETYLQLGQQGLYPLFSKKAIKESLAAKNQNVLSVVRAQKILNLHFGKIEHFSHETDKSKYIHQLKKDEKELFIQAFFKLVEVETLSKHRELH